LNGGLELRDVRFAHRADGVEAFRLVVPRLDVAAGERVACIGPSGSGKTTLIELVAGIRVPDAGRVTVGDVVVSALDDDARRAWRRARVGLVFQEFELLEYLTAEENAVLPCTLGAGLARAAALARARELMASCGIEHAARRLPARLSQGERQRVAVCRALVTRPDVLLCDEGTGNLDPRNARATLDLLLRVARAAGATVLFVTHDHGLLERFDRVVDLAELRA
jgi:ABC-type lipoprotein export system ATPase subunit